MLRASSAFTFCLLAATAAAQAFPCFESNLGANLALGDDQVAGNLPLGFSFPRPGGGSVTSIDVSSNGFIWLANNANPRCCNGEANKLLIQPPSICALWVDLDPSAAAPGGGVFFNSFPAVGTTPARAVITWKDVPEFGNTNTFTFQLQINAAGAMFFRYEPGISVFNHTALVGCSEGNTNPAGSAQWNFIDITNNNPPIDTGTNPTFFEELPSWSIDVADRTIEITPNGQGGYSIATPSHCQPAAWSKYGGGCPREPVFYEFFQQPNTIDLANTAILVAPNGTGGWVALPGTGFYTPTSPPIATGDDVVTGPFALPWTWAWSGGLTNAIDISSNGFIWLNAGNGNSRCCSGDPFALLADPASICGHWMDLAPHVAGTIHFDIDPVTTDVHITWLGVPEYGTGSSTSNTFQISLFANGSFRLSYQNVTSLNHDSLTGFSPGAALSDPGSTDLTLAIPFDTGPGGVPLTLDAVNGAQPQIGTTFVLELGNIPSGSVIGFMVFGFTQLQPGFDLAPFGMPGCSLFATLDSLQSFPLIPQAQFSWPLPNNPAIVGFQIFVQGAALAPAANPLGLIVSNAGSILVGL